MNAQRIEGIATLRMPRTGHTLHVDSGAVDQLQTLVDKGLRAPPRGVEVGGILVGTTTGHKEIDIEGVLGIAGEPAEGVFRFATAGREAMKALIPGNEARLIGLYRSHNRNSAVCIDEEREVLAELLPDAGLIWIVRPAGPLQSTCHVYIRTSRWRWTEAGEVTLPSLSVSSPPPRRGTGIRLLPPASDPTMLPPGEQPNIDATQNASVANRDSAVGSIGPGGDPGIRRMRRTVVRALVIGSIACLGFGGFVVVTGSPQSWWRGSPTVYSTGRSGSRTEWPLDFQAQRQGGDVKLTWSRDATAALQATSGVLMIDDGTIRQLALDSVLVRRGSILYAPTTDRVEVQLTISTAAGPVSESLMVIMPVAGASRPTTRGAEAIPLERAGATAPPAGFGEQRPATRPFALPATPLVRKSPAVLDEPPPLRGNEGGAVSAMTVTLPQLPAPKPPIAVEEERPPAPAYRYEPPVITKRVTPSYPPSLRGTVLTATSVEVRVGIDESGNVVTVTPVPQERAAPPTIVKSAVEAARMWKFKPARTNNQPVPSEMILQFRFRPSQQ
jgi:Gram-negative bacterial TonB protein C-terminal